MEVDFAMDDVLLADPDTLSLHAATLRTFKMKCDPMQSKRAPGRVVRLDPSGCEWRVEDAVLKRLRYFRGMERMSSVPNEVIVIVEHDHCAFGILLEALHCNNANALVEFVGRHVERILYISHLADKYGFPALSRVCDAFSVACLNLDTAANVFGFWNPRGNHDNTHFSLCPDPYTDPTMHGALAWLRITLATESLTSGEPSKAFVSALHQAPSWCLLQLLEFAGSDRAFAMVGRAILARAEGWDRDGECLAGWNRVLAAMATSSVNSPLCGIRPTRTFDEAFPPRPTLKRYNSSEMATEHYSRARLSRARRLSARDIENVQGCRAACRRCDHANAVTRWLHFSKPVALTWNGTALAFSDILNIGTEDEHGKIALSAQVVVHRNESNCASISLQIRRSHAARLGPLSLVGTCAFSGNSKSSYQPGALDLPFKAATPNPFRRPVALSKIIAKDQRTGILLTFTAPWAFIDAPKHSIGLHLTLGVLNRR